MLERISKKSRIIRHRLTGFIRVLPDFLIIGVPRAGTTSLYNYMINHPSIKPPLWKEIGFFNEHYTKDITWYKSHFPSVLLKYYIEKLKKKKFLTGEASPDYLFHPLAPRRIFEMIPKVKMIILLRNPIDRAWSHYWQSIRKNRETLSFEEAIRKQMKVEQETNREKVSQKNNYGANLNQYISTGIYPPRIKKYMEIFPKEQFLIIKSEDLYDNPQSVLNRISEFLDIPKWNKNNYNKYQYNSDQPKMEKDLRKQLLEFYQPYNERLNKFLGVNFSWDI